MNQMWLVFPLEYDYKPLANFISLHIKLKILISVLNENPGKSEIFAMLETFLRFWFKQMPVNSYEHFAYTLCKYVKTINFCWQLLSSIFSQTVAYLTELIVWSKFWFSISSQIFWIQHAKTRLVNIIVCWRRCHYSNDIQVYMCVNHSCEIYRKFYVALNCCQWKQTNS